MGCEVMVSELLRARLAPDNQPLNAYRVPLARNPFAEQYLSLRSEHIPSIVRDLVERNEGSFEWTSLLPLDPDEAVIDELLKHVGADEFFNPKASNEDAFLVALVRWGYATLLEKFGPQVSMYHKQLHSKDLQKTPKFRLEPLLHIACRRQLPNLPVLTVLVDKFGVDVNAHRHSHRSVGPWQGDTALHVLVNFGEAHRWQRGAIEFLLQRGADIEAKNEKGESPLSQIVGRNVSPGLWKDAVVNILLRHGADSNSVASDGSTCLAKASSNPAMMRKLVEHGADIGTPALLAAIKSKDLTTVAAMIEAGASINARQEVTVNSDNVRSRMEKRARTRENVATTTTEMMPLHYAASAEQNKEQTRKQALPIVRLLLERGADAYAVFDGDKTIVHHLLEFGGILQPFLELPTLDLEQRNSCGRTLLLAGCRSRFSPSRALDDRSTEKYPIVAAILYSMGADITARDSKGMNALHHLLLQTRVYNEASYLETFAVFVKGAPLLVHQKDLEGHSPLHYALRRRLVWCIETLLSAGADPLEPDSEGNTALHHLAKVVCADPKRSEQTQLFRKFLALGVPINGKNNVGDTPLFHYILVNDENEIQLRAEMLRQDLTIFEEAGADFLARNNDMESVLHLAAKTIEYRKEYRVPYRMHHPPVNRFKFLVELGCDPLAENVNQRTALDVAAAYRNNGILELFQRGGELNLAPES